MNLQRVQTDIQQAAEHFPNIETYTTTGRPLHQGSATDIGRPTHIIGHVCRLSVVNAERR